MMLLDTSVLIDLDRGSPGTVEKASELDGSGPHAVSSVTIFEFIFGIHLRYEGEALAVALREAEEFLSAFVIMPLRGEESLLAAEIAAGLRRSGKDIGVHDTYIAATAIQNGLTLLAGNPRHFDRIPGVEVRHW